MLRGSRPPALKQVKLPATPAGLGQGRVVLQAGAKKRAPAVAKFDDNDSDFSSSDGSVADVRRNVPQKPAPTAPMRAPKPAGRAGRRRDPSPDSLSYSSDYSSSSSSGASSQSRGRGRADKGRQKKAPSRHGDDAFYREDGLDKKVKDEAERHDILMRLHNLYTTRKDIVRNKKINENSSLSELRLELGQIMHGITVRSARETESIAFVGALGGLEWAAGQAVVPAVVRNSMDGLSTFIGDRVHEYDDSLNLVAERYGPTLFGDGSDPLWAVALLFAKHCMLFLMDKRSKQQALNNEEMRLQMERIVDAKFAQERARQAPAVAMYAPPPRTAPEPARQQQQQQPAPRQQQQQYQYGASSSGFNPFVPAAPAPKVAVHRPVDPPYISDVDGVLMADGVPTDMRTVEQALASIRHPAPPPPRSDFSQFVETGPATARDPNAVYEPVVVAESRAVDIAGSEPVAAVPTAGNGKKAKSVRLEAIAQLDA